MSTETIEFSAQEFRDDSLSRKSDGAVITHASLEALREGYASSHPELNVAQESSVSVSEFTL